jgi:acyl-CoA hydrolase
VWVENYFTGEMRHLSSAYLTFVAVSQDGKKRAAPPVIPETAEQIRRFEDAGHRREIRRAEAARKAVNSRA